MIFASTIYIACRGLQKIELLVAASKRVFFKNFMIGGWLSWNNADTPNAIPPQRWLCVRNPPTLLDSDSKILLVRWRPYRSFQFFRLSFMLFRNKKPVGLFSRGYKYRLSVRRRHGIFLRLQIRTLSRLQRLKWMLTQVPFLIQQQTRQKHLNPMSTILRWKLWQKGK